MKLSTAFISVVTVLTGVSALKLTYPEEAALFARYNPPVKHRRQAPNAGNFTAAYNSMINAYNTATGQQAIQNDINNLTATVLFIEKAFTNVTVKLTQIDALNLAPPFTPTWKILQQNWTDILWDSRTTAAQLAAYCQDFESVILPFSLGLLPGQPIPSQAQTIATLQGFQADAQKFEVQAQLTSDAFNQIIKNLTLFAGSFESFAATQSQLDNAAVELIRSNLDVLKKILVDLQDQMVTIARNIEITVFTSIAAVAIFPVFAPIIIGVGAGLVAIEKDQWSSVNAQRIETLNEIAGNKTKLISLESELATIALANATLVDIASTTIPALQNSIGDFRDIWNAVTADINQVIQYITLAQGSASSNTFIPFIVYARLSNVNSIYAPLGNALVSYAAGIANSNIPPPTSTSVSPAILSVATTPGAKFATAPVHPFTDISQVYFSPTVAMVKQMIADHQTSKM